MQGNLATPFTFALIFVASLISPTYEAALDPRAAGCTLTLRPGPLLPRGPLFLKPGGSLDVFRYLDADASGSVSLNSGEQVLIACPGSKVGGRTEEVIAFCESGTNFIVDGKSTALTALDCDKHPTHSDVATGRKCGSNNRGTHAVIGHSTSAGFINLIEVGDDADASLTTQPPSSRRQRTSALRRFFALFVLAAVSVALKALRNELER